MRSAAMGLVTMLLAAGAAQAAQVDVTSAGGSSVHVDRGGDVHIRSADGSTIRVHGSGAVSSPAARGSASIGCPGGRLEVAGSGARLNVQGPCRIVQVSGSRNTVRVRLASGATAEIAGSHNVLIWTLAHPGDAPPRVETTGSGNQSRRG